MRALLFGFFTDIFNGLSFTEGLLLLVLVASSVWIYKSHRSHLSSKQSEIDRLVKEKDTLNKRIDALIEQLIATVRGKTGKMTGVETNPKRKRK